MSSYRGTRSRGRDPWLPGNLSLFGGEMSRRFACLSRCPPLAIVVVVDCVVVGAVVGAVVVAAVVVVATVVVVVGCVVVVVGCSVVVVDFVVVRVVVVGVRSGPASAGPDRSRVPGRSPVGAITFAGDLPHGDSAVLGAHTSEQRDTWSDRSPKRLFMLLAVAAAILLFMLLAVAAAIRSAVLHIAGRHAAIPSGVATSSRGRHRRDEPVSMRRGRSTRRRIAPQRFLSAMRKGADW